MTYGRQTYGVILQEEEIAREFGALLVFLLPHKGVQGVTALSYKTGAILRRGSELWVKADLAKHGIKVLHELRP